MYCQMQCALSSITSPAATVHSRLQETRHPQKMTSEEWIDVKKLIVQLEMSFNYSQTQFKVYEPKPMGHKVKLVQQVLQPKPAVGKQLKYVASEAEKKSPQPGKNKKANARICTDPCRYVHYDDLSPKTSKSGVLKRCMFVADATKAWLKNQITKDKKLQ